jgi:hypothetical protein
VAMMGINTRLNSCGIINHPINTNELRITIMRELQANQRPFFAEIKNV